MKVTIITRKMCSGCEDTKEILSAHDIEFVELSATTKEGMAELALIFNGPDTLLPAILCDCYADMESLIDLLDQTLPRTNVQHTIGVRHL